jgi:hypothetical protein
MRFIDLLRFVVVGCALRGNPDRKRKAEMGSAEIFERSLRLLDGTFGRGPAPPNKIMPGSQPVKTNK